MPLRAFAARLALVALAASAVALAWQGGRILEARLAPQDPPTIEVAPAPRAADEEKTIALFERAKDSVVFISTQTRVQDFWRRAREVPRGTGSGFVWDDAGHVVTNAHVLRGATGATVRLADGSTHEASLVGAAPQHDLAVLKIDADDLSPLPRGESAGVRVGQSTFAIGNPFGLDFTLTTGVVSALDRELPSDQGPDLRGLIQTDAAINPGNSGGPLLDSAGRMIGVNTAIYSPSGSSAGIGFAVPAETVGRVVPQLIRTGSYAPPSLGVEVDERVNAMARRQGVEGVLVLGVTPGSAAERAGLEPARATRDGRIVPGDVIVGLGGTEVRSVEDLFAALDSRSAGEETTLRIRREGATEEMTVTLDPPRRG
ncbi:MAG: PDZ domain-containing protein [Deinococcus-Thermus bacterium]|jgi:S1-C subfamily serine protease|nr:PDZ domain-containing protein [Deinococcota bacterium]